MGEKEGGRGSEKRGCITNITPPSQVGRALVVATQTRTTKTHKLQLLPCPQTFLQTKSDKKRMQYIPVLALYLLHIKIKQNKHINYPLKRK